MYKYVYTFMLCSLVAADAFPNLMFMGGYFSHFPADSQGVQVGYQPREGSAMIRFLIFTSDM